MPGLTGCLSSAVSSTLWSPGWDDAAAAAGRHASVSASTPRWPARRLISWIYARRDRMDHGSDESPPGYSHSIVPGGFDVMSSVTRLTCAISLIIREATLSSRSYGSRAQSAVIASSEVTALITTT